MSKKKIKEEDKNSSYQEETSEQNGDNFLNEQQSENQTDEIKEEQDNCAESDLIGQIESLKNELKDENDKRLRIIAEYENYRKRTLKEKIELSKTAGEKIFTGILHLVDDFERALKHIDQATDIKAVKEGVELINGKFINFLLQHGVKEIEAVGKDFDADIYDAVANVPAPNENMKGKIMDCVEKGYMLDDKVIRFPKVVVAE